jgi:type VI secretion system protein ImpK
MRLVDFYIDALLTTRSLVPMLAVETGQDAESIRNKLISLLEQAQQQVADNNYSVYQAEAALFPVVAYIDEMILTSGWNEKSSWQQNPLQRHFFDTMNAGQEFYERLNKLNRQGEDRSIREVFLLCLGIGYKGQYFMPEDRPKLEEVRVFNLDLLLPEEANKTLEKTTLFDEAYQETIREGRRATSRVNLMPLFTAVPVVIIVSIFVFYATQITGWLNKIMDMVK